MSEGGMYRLPQLQAWQRENILAAASFLRSRFGNPPGDASAKAVHDGLLEVLDPPHGTSERRTGQRRSGRDRRSKT